MTSPDDQRTESVRYSSASYSGDVNSNPAATNCGGKSVTIGKASPAITTSPSQGGSTGTR